MCRPSLALRVAAALVLVAPPAAAQPTAPAGRRDSVATDPFCWRGRPLPYCREFALFELGYHVRLASTELRETVPVYGADGQSFESRRPDAQSQFLWTVGLMRNRGARSAVGGGVIVGANEQGGVYGLQGRYRRWLGASMSADVGLGGARMATPEPVYRPADRFVQDPWRFGVLLDGHLNAGDRLAAGARLVVIPGGGRTRVGVLAGGRLGTNYAVAGTLAVGAFFVALIASLGEDY